MSSRKPAGNLVYSTSQGKMCPGCCRPIADCVCRRPPASAGDGIVRISHQTKGRKGKGVTIISGVPLDGEALKTYAATLKKKCGTGGAVKQQNIEIQGDHRDRLQQELEKAGWTVKRSGG